MDPDCESWITTSMSGGLQELFAFLFSQDSCVETSNMELIATKRCQVVNLSNVENLSLAYNAKFVAL